MVSGTKGRRFESCWGRHVERAVRRAALSTCMDATRRELLAVAARSEAESGAEVVRQVRMVGVAEFARESGQVQGGIEAEPFGRFVKPSAADQCARRQADVTGGDALECARGDVRVRREVGDGEDGRIGLNCDRLVARMARIFKRGPVRDTYVRRMATAAHGAFTDNGMPRGASSITPFMRSRAPAMRSTSTATCSAPAWSM